MGVYTNELLNRNLSILKSRAHKEAIQGVAIAMGAIVAATVSVTLLETPEFTLEGLVKVQTENFALWVLDAMAFVFPLWGQYSSQIIAYEASALVRDQTEELRVRADQLEKEKKFAATHDAVTDLPNRILFYDRVEQAIRIAWHAEQSLAVMVLQVENLKEIQDTLGPASADLILKQLAARLLQTMSGRDSVARIDSQNFAILLDGSTDRDAAEQAAHRLQKALGMLFDANRLKLSLHTSIGIVLFPEHGEDADTLVQRAGVALYMASQSHDGHAFYSPAFDEHSPRRLTLMGELQHALERNHLELYYQPKLDIHSRHVIGAEALVRWRHPKHGFIPPDEFIGLAERSRMIKPLTQWVMERAFRDTAAWRAEGLELVISVNLSPKDLHDPELPDRIVGTMAKTGVQPAWFIFEITESSIIVDPDRVLNVLERIHSLGFGLSIDDFGTGYSSLAYLKKLPVSELKIDKSFVKDMLEGENDAVIVRATVDLAHNLGLKVTAEGVESDEIMVALEGYHCDVAQGYYLSRPLPTPEFRQWLDSSGWQLQCGPERHSPEP